MASQINSAGQLLWLPFFSVTSFLLFQFCAGLEMNRSFIEILLTIVCLA